MKLVKQSEFLICFDSRNELYNNNKIKILQPYSLYLNRKQTGKNYNIFQEMAKQAIFNCYFPRGMFASIFHFYLKYIENTI